MANIATAAPEPSTQNRVAPTAGAAHIIEQLKANQTAANQTGLGGPAMDAFYEEVIRIVGESPNPEGTLGAIAQLLVRERGTASACPIYRDCTEIGPHYDHSSDNLRVTGEDGSTILDAGMVANSGPDWHAIVYIRNEEFTDAASARAKTAELRSFLNQVDEMVDRIFADHKGQA